MSDGWRLGSKALGLIKETCNGRWEPKVFVEFGSGTGTPALARALPDETNLYSVEHAMEWVGTHRDVTTYLHAPLLNGWYDMSYLAPLWPQGGVDAVLIDGPPGNEGTRSQILRYWDKLKLSAGHIFVDDTHRQDEAYLVDFLIDRYYLKRTDVMDGSRKFTALT
jgi:hypothetical protein